MWPCVIAWVAQCRPEILMIPCLPLCFKIHGHRFQSPGTNGLLMLLRLQSLCNGTCVGSYRYGRVILWSPLGVQIRTTSLLPPFPTMPKWPETTWISWAAKLSKFAFLQSFANSWGVTWGISGTRGNVRGWRVAAGGLPWPPLSSGLGAAHCCREMRFSGDCRAPEIHRALLYNPSSEISTDRSLTHIFFSAFYFPRAGVSCSVLFQLISLSMRDAAVSTGPSPVCPRSDQCTRIFGLLVSFTSIYRLPGHGLSAAMPGPHSNVLYLRSISLGISHCCRWALRLPTNHRHASSVAVIQRKALPRHISMPNQLPPGKNLCSLLSLTLHPANKIPNLFVPDLSHWARGLHRVFALQQLPHLLLLSHSLCFFL